MCLRINKRNTISAGSPIRPGRRLLGCRLASASYTAATICSSASTRSACSIQSSRRSLTSSAINPSTTVALYLPKATQKPDAGVEAIQPQAIPKGSDRILVVEDNEDVLEVTSAMLTTFGYWVVCARNGAEAIQMLESGQEFELLFSDVVMPNGMNGVERTREARRLSNGIKMLLTSGDAGAVLARHLAAGALPILARTLR